MDFVIFYTDVCFHDVVTWPPSEMGNTCQCLGGGKNYAVVNKRHPSGSVSEDDRSPGGSYRKTAAKYKVPSAQQVHTDLNRNRPPEAELNLELQTSEREVEGFFTALEEHESEESEKMQLSSSSESGVTTHIHTFSAPHPASNGDVVTNDESQGSGTKTHVEVFNLSMPSDSPKHENTASPQSQPTETAHINFSDYLTEEKSAPSSPSKSPQRGIQNESFEATPTDDPVSPESVPVVDFTNYQLPQKTESPALEISTTSSPSKSSSKSQSSPQSGITNEAFDISDELEVSPTVCAQVTKQPVAVDDHDVSDLEIPDENCFFFGMESLKFKSKDYDGEEADRELAEIMSALDTIEDSLWITLKPPEDETDSAKLRMDLASDVAVKRSDADVMYGSVLNHLKDMCSKVEDILKKRGVNISDEFEEGWLNLPDLSSIHSRYNKDTVSLQTDTTTSLIQASEVNDEDRLRQILEDYKLQQERLLRMREAQRRKLLDRLRSKISGRKDHKPAAEEGGDEDGDSDTEKVRDQYGEIMKTGSEGDVREEETEESLATSDSETSFGESEYSSDISSDDLAVLTEGDIATINTLKATLTKDIGSKMAEMTSDDFQSIMHMYRKERQGIRDIRESERDKLGQSLWDKLTERRRRKDEDIHEEEDPKLEEVLARSSPWPVSVGVEASVSTHDSHTSPESSHTQDAATGTEDDDVLKGLEKCEGVTGEELEQLKNELIERTLQKSTADPLTMGWDDADQLLREHFSNVRRLRERKEVEAEKHRLKALEKLKERKQEQDEKHVCFEEVDFASLEKDEESLEEKCLQTFRQRETVTPGDLQDLLVQYNQQQQSLMEQRVRQRATLNQRLREKLRAADNARNQENGSSNEEEEINPEKQIKSMDDAFYQSLVALKQEGNLSQEQLTQLIDEHLDLVDEFRREVKEQLASRRRERRLQADPEQLSALVEEDKQNREQVRRVRQQEKDRMDDKLQEKLRRKKQKRLEEEKRGPGVPPRKPERKKKSSKKERNPQPQAASYENMEPKV